MFALRGEAWLHAAASWIVGKPGGGDGGASHGIGREEVIAGAFKAATLLDSARLDGAGMLDCWAKVAGTVACCCEPKWLWPAASVVAGIGPNWPVEVFELSSGWSECMGLGRAGGAEAALSEFPSEVAWAHEGGSPRDDWGRIEEDSMSS